MFANVCNLIKWNIDGQEDRFYSHSISLSCFFGMVSPFLGALPYIKLIWITKSEYVCLIISFQWHWLLYLLSFWLFFSWSDSMMMALVNNNRLDIILCIFRCCIICLHLIANSFNKPYCNSNLFRHLILRTSLVRYYSLSCCCNLSTYYYYCTDDWFIPCFVKEIWQTGHLKCW